MQKISQPSVEPSINQSQLFSQSMQQSTSISESQVIQNSLIDFLYNTTVISDVTYQELEKNDMAQALELIKFLLTPRVEKDKIEYEKLRKALQMGMSIITYYYNSDFITNLVKSDQIMNYLFIFWDQNIKTDYVKGNYAKIFLQIYQNTENQEVFFSKILDFESRIFSELLGKIDNFSFAEITKQILSQQVQNQQSQHIKKKILFTIFKNLEEQIFKNRNNKEETEYVAGFHYIFDYIFEYYEHDGEGDFKLVYDYFLEKFQQFSQFCLKANSYDRAYFVKLAKYFFKMSSEDNRVQHLLKLLLDTLKRNVQQYKLEIRPFEQQKVGQEFLNQWGNLTKPIDLDVYEILSIIANIFEFSKNQQEGTQHGDLINIIKGQPQLIQLLIQKYVFECWHNNIIHHLVIKIIRLVIELKIDSLVSQFLEMHGQFGNFINNHIQYYFRYGNKPDKKAKTQFGNSGPLSYFVMLVNCLYNYKLGSIPIDDLDSQYIKDLVDQKYTQWLIIFETQDFLDKSSNWENLESEPLGMMVSKVLPQMYVPKIQVKQEEDYNIQNIFKEDIYTSINLNISTQISEITLRDSYIQGPDFLDYVVVGSMLNSQVNSQQDLQLSKASSIKSIKSMFGESYLNPQDLKKMNQSNIY